MGRTKLLQNLLCGADEEVTQKEADQGCKRQSFYDFWTSKRNEKMLPRRSTYLALHQTKRYFYVFIAHIKRVSICWNEIVLFQLIISFSNPTH